MELPKRKKMRLYQYDYSLPGAYFVTICTKNKKCLFGDISKGCVFAVKENINNFDIDVNIVGADSISARMINQTFRATIGKYKYARCNYFVIMPNHFHAIIEIERADI